MQIKYMKYIVTKIEGRFTLVESVFNNSQFPITLETDPKDQKYWDLIKNKSIDENDFEIEEHFIGEEDGMETYQLIAKPKK